MDALVEVLRDAAPWIKAGVVAYAVWFGIVAIIALTIIFKVLRRLR